VLEVIRAIELPFQNYRTKKRRSIETFARLASRPRVQTYILCYCHSCKLIIVIQDSAPLCYLSRRPCIIGTVVT